MNRTLLFILKVVVSAGLLVYLLQSVDLADVYRHFVEGDHELFGVSVVIYFVVVILSTVRWMVLLRAVGGQADFRKLTESYMVSAFFANFLPSNVGGDVVRVQEAAKAAGSHTASLAVAAVDRIAGFVALYFIAAPAFLFGGPALRGLSGARFILIGLTALFSVMGVLFLRAGLVTRIVEIIGLKRLPWVYEKFATLQAAIQSFRQSKAALVKAFLLSLVLQFLGVSYFYFVARALRIPLDLGVALLMVPLCVLIQALPISFNGWGVREGVYVLYFRQVGLPKESALAFSIVAAALVVLLSISGLLVWLARRSETTPPADPALS
ncbi:MAG: lysylphosphatidylglycerol synthase transmembrane domain-containing protein [Vicinamibacteria bacterium]